MTPWLPIETERLILREFELRDEPGLRAYESDPEVARFDDWGPNTAEETNAILRSVLADQQHWPRDAVATAIELQSEGALVGSIHLAVRDKKNRTADIGFTINRHYWGRGYASEATAAFVDALFRRLDMHRVCASCDTRNRGSHRVLEKLGMRREGLFRGNVQQRGDWRDSYFYAILSDEWIGRGTTH
jgi:ribosomal-protein-alanine N-acetyltransferase